MSIFISVEGTDDGPPRIEAQFEGGDEPEYAPDFQGDIEAAIAWGRERSDSIFVQVVGQGGYSAGGKPIAGDPEDGEPDVYPSWPPPDLLWPPPAWPPVEVEGFVSQLAERMECLIASASPDWQDVAVLSRLVSWGPFGGTHVSVCIRVPWTQSTYCAEFDEADWVSTDLEASKAAAAIERDLEQLRQGSGEEALAVLERGTPLVQAVEVRPATVRHLETDS